ncbi:MAG: carbonic anhydrase family protein [Elusimicrobiota bacterium]|nr:carbonic anhydrase family protein [Elusimicrobiota bacterium]
MKTLILSGLLLLAAAPRVRADAAHAGAPAVPAGTALNKLKTGAMRFAAGSSRPHAYLKEVRASAKGQHPFAAVLGCIDSRVDPEIIFDQGLGDLFSMRVAGGVADDDALGGLEYAAKVSGVRLIVVLGHSHCGAVKGACDGVKLGNLTGLLARIKPAVDAVPADGRPHDSSNPDFVARVARENVLLGIRTIREKSPILAALEKSGELKIVGAMYDVETGRTEFYK